MADVTFKPKNDEKVVLPENKKVVPPKEDQPQDVKEEFPLNQPNPLIKPIVK